MTSGTYLTPCCFGGQRIFPQNVKVSDRQNLAPGKERQLSGTTSSRDIKNKYIIAMHPKPTLLCESRGGRPGLLGPNKPHGF